MFKEIFRFELRYRLKRPAVYICMAIPFLFACYSFSSGSVAAAEHQFYNAPAVLARFCALMSFFTLLLTSAIMGPPMYRDLEYGSADYYLAYPISKAGYFFGRFAGSFLFIVFMSVFLLFGAYLGTLSGTHGSYGPNRLWAYLLPLFTLLLPNLLLCSVLFFGLVAVTRNERVIYSSGVLLLLAYMAARLYFDFSSNDTVSQLADPFAYNSVRLLTAGYSPSRLNTAYLPLSGLFLLNRLIWLGLSLLLLVLTYARFDLAAFFTRKSKKLPPVLAESTPLSLPQAQPDFKRGYQRSALAGQLGMEIKGLVKDRFFWLIILAMTLFEGFSFWLGSENYQVRDLPRTVMLLNSFKNDILPYLFVIIVFYTGEVLHRERSGRFAMINDALPPSTFLFHLAKVAGLLLMGAFIVFIPVITGMFTQLTKGYTDFHPGLYLESFLFVSLPQITLMVLLAYFVHVLTGHKFAGHITGILLWFGFTQLLPGYTDLNYHLLLYGTAPFFNFSDMEGAGQMLKAVNSFHLYWLLCGGLLFLAAYLFYQRGVPVTLRERFRVAHSRSTPRFTAALNFVLFAFLVTGSFIYYNVSVLNRYQTEDDEALRSVMYEQVFKRYAAVPQPEIGNLSLKAFLDPEGQSAAVSGRITLVNRSRQRLDSVLADGEALNSYALSYQGEPLRYTAPLLYFRPSYSFFGPAADTSRCRVYALPKALLPGDSVVLDFRSAVAHRGFGNDLDGTDITPNGTCFYGGLPAIGYNRGKELSDNGERAKYHLAAKKTTEGQRAFAIPLTATRLEASTRNGQTIVTSAAGLPAVILSARYAVKKDKDLPVAVYYYPGHDCNADRLLAALKDGMVQESAAYGPLPFAKLQLAETSNYGPYMAVYPGLVTYAEYFAWQADYSRPYPFDYDAFVTARAVAQQWWKFGLKLSGKAGTGIIPEGLATYDALRQQEKKYGRDALTPLLAYEQEHYLVPSKREAPETLLQSDRSYNNDAKAGLILYGLSRLIGEERMGRALHAFRDSCRLIPYGSEDLLRFLKRYTPDSLQYFLSDGFEKNTIYDNKVVTISAIAAAQKDQYHVTLTCSTAKYTIDTQGGRHLVQMNDQVEIVVRGVDGKVLLEKECCMTDGIHILKFTVTGKPATVGVDPWLNLIDVNTSDNSLEIK